MDRPRRRSFRRALCGIALALATPLAGCGPKPPAAPAAAPVEVRLIDHAGLEAAVAEHRGKVVVLDCWSTSCPPCIREFPNLIALARTLPDDVVCMSLSFDYEGIGTPDDALPRVREFLAAVGAGGIVNLLAREESDVMCRKLDLVSVPAVYVWKRDGTLARRFDDDDAARRLGRPFTYADVEETVREALAATPR